MVAFNSNSLGNTKACNIPSPSMEKEKKVHIPKTQSNHTYYSTTPTQHHTSSIKIIINQKNKTKFSHQPNMFFSSNKHLIILLIFPFLLSILFTKTHSSKSHHQCTTKFSEITQARNLPKCHKLTTLGAELAWSEPLLQNNHYNLIHIIFGAVMDEDMGWLAWGVNAGSPPQMIGTKAAIGIKNANNSFFCKSYNVTIETRIGCRLRPTQLEEVNCTAFEYNRSLDYYMVSATLNLSAIYNMSKLNIVWQIGYEVDGDEPKMHSARLQNVDSVETLNLYTQKSTGVGHLRIYLRKVHGIMNIIGWGTLLPLGVIIARYFRRFPFKCKSWWFYFHVTCQITGFVFGVIGWGIGLWLGHASKHYIFLTHRVIAIFIFTFTTLQMLALRLKPKKDDEFRKLWDIYHHFLGYALLAVIAANIFRGIGILKPDNKDWKWAYIGILISLGSIFFFLELYTWKKFFYDRSQWKEEPSTYLPQPPEEEDSMENRPF